MLATRLRMRTTEETAFYPYTIDQSCRFNSANSAYLSWTPGVTGTRTIHSLSFWIKRCNLTLETGGIFGGGSALNNCTQYAIKSSERLQFKHEDSSVQDSNINFDPLLRDPASWMHIFCVYDSTEGTSTDRLKVWYNGVEVFDAAGANYISLNKISDISSQNQHFIGRSRMDDTGRYGDYYLAEFQVLDGIVGTVTDFGEFKYGIWIPKRYTGSYGTNGFYQKYDDSSDLGKDSSGNGNDWTSNNLAAADQVLDTPTNNYPTLNVIHHLSTATLANGNLDCSGAENEYATIVIPSTGKWGWEITVAENGSFGLEDIDANEEVAADVSGEVVEMLVDMDAGTLKKKVDGGSLETIEATLSTTAEWYPHFKAACSVDFGQLGYSPSEAGYKTLCSENLTELAASTDDYSDCATEDEYSSGTYTGNGSTDGPVVYLGYRPTDVCIDGDHYDETSSVIDILSNGFKLRSATKNTNTSSYDWEAWLYQDGKYSNAAPNVT